MRNWGDCWAQTVSAPRLLASKAAVPYKNRRLARTALGMARVAIRTVVNIIPDPSVVGVRSRLVVRMAREAREHRVVRGIGMAVGTACPSAGMSA